jgi:Uncharacterized protein conserved in bacteria (DUF2252)
VPELVPIRYGRMSASPFAFYRGAAYVMASDLAGCPQSGIRVQLCGDVAGRENGFKAKRRIAIVRELVGEYRQAIRRFATMKTLDVWYARARVSDLQKLTR